MTFKMYDGTNNRILSIMEAFSFTPDFATYTPSNPDSLTIQSPSNSIVGMHKNGLSDLSFSNLNYRAKLNSVSLNWKVNDYSSASGFKIERSEQADTNKWNEIAYIDSKNYMNYSFIDNNITSHKYQYRLKAVDVEGNYKYSNKIDVITEIPSRYFLGQNYPNPFNPSTQINFQIEKKGLVTLKVYNILGQEVMQLINKQMDEGNYSISFNGNNLTSGIYFYRLNSGNYSAVKKMIVIK
jgi:Secretion system C-terminal sorting domain